VASLRALAPILRSRGPVAMLKNLAVYPKGLWLGHLARSWKADHVHAQWGLTTATMAMVASRVSGVPWSCTVHRGDIVDNNLLEIKSRDARFFRVISKDGIGLAAEVCGRALEGDVITLHLGVDVPDRLPEARPLHDPAVLFCPAYLMERKGQRYLIEALALLGGRGIHPRLWLVGEGETCGELEAMTREFGLSECVTFLPNLGHHELLDLYRAGRVDLVVLPALHEGIPVCLMEAMAHGVPVLSTSVGGIPELLRDGAGLMVPAKDPASLAEGIERLLGDAELRRQLACAGRRRVDKEFAVAGIVSRLVDHMQSVSEASREFSP
jgi:colanic acid/amylovoran biosynthesis glycosyltransferase